MKIAVISDTHGDTRGWQAAIAGPFAGADLILHAGDVFYHGPRNSMPPGYDPAALAELINRAPAPVIIARGNCDSEVDQLVLEYPIQAPYAFVAIEACPPADWRACPPAVWRGRRIMVAHGTEFGLDNPVPGLAGLAEKYRLDVLVCGHTHRPLLERVARSPHSGDRHGGPVGLAAGSTLIMNPGSPSLPKSRTGDPVPTVGVIEDDMARVITLDGIAILEAPLRGGA